MSPGSRRAPPPAARARARTLLPSTLLVASGPFGARLPAARVLAAIACGLRSGGRPDPDLCPLPAGGALTAEVRELLEEVQLDARLHRARAVIVGAERLHERTLAGSVTFEIATRARQGGVPAFAVTREHALDSFDARVLDLQLILQARSARALVAAGRKLAQLA